MSSGLKLNLGCGPLKLEGETGVDLYPTPNCDVQADITSRLPFDDGCADQVRLDHVMEHLERSAAFSVLLEAHRLLRVGGKLIVGVPDLEAYCKVWLEARDDMQLKQDLLHGIYGAQTHVGEFHRNGFDVYVLQDMFEAAGFEVESIEPDTAPWRTEGFCISAVGIKK